jgi:poly-gamma-glutamate capsule biosynthesis protein CapA/YwtB (metallophosphatase superfamily)
VRTIIKGGQRLMLTLAAVGDCMLGRRVSELQDPDFLALVELLRSADCVWGNCEMVCSNPEAVYRAYKEIDPHVLCEPWAADELRFMGINLMGTANNHTMDFGDAGLVSTLESLDRAGIIHAGAGLDLIQAARPAFLKTAAGRVALVACASSFFDHYAAGLPHSTFKGRPGLNPLQIQYAVEVDDALFKELEQAQTILQDLLGWQEMADTLRQMERLRPAGTTLFLETPIRAAQKVDVRSHPRLTDVDRVVKAIQIARPRARLVIVSVHAHGMRGNAETPDPFLPSFARVCLEAGADICLVTGPHVLRGIEIYEGKPVFYSLGNFFSHFDGFSRFAAPAKAPAHPSPAPPAKPEKIGLHHQRRFWESFVPRVTFADNGEVLDIELYPVTLGLEGPTCEHGTPRLARGNEANRILTRLVDLSQLYATRIDLEGEVGRVRLR